jgi:hypothetical protein
MVAMTATEIAERYGLRAVALLALALLAFLLLHPVRKTLLLAARVLEVALQRLDTVVAPALPTEEVPGRAAT